MRHGRAIIPAHILSDGAAGTLSKFSASVCLSELSYLLIFPKLMRNDAGSNNSVQSNGHLAVNMNSSSNDPNCRPNFLGCHFELYSPSDSNYASNSDRWFVTENAAAQPVTWNATNATSSGGSTTVSPGTPVTTTVSGTPVTITGTTTGQPSSSPSPSPVPPPAGLSTGAKAGIGVGVVSGVILLAAAAFAAYRFQQRKIARNKDAQEKDSINALGLHELQGGPKPQELQETKASHHALGVHELQDVSKPQEMQGTVVGEPGAEARVYELAQAERRGEE